jgi:hypothetical protein
MPRDVDPPLLPPRQHLEPPRGPGGSRELGGGRGGPKVLRRENAPIE